jgi:hypothetical protein
MSDKCVREGAINALDYEYSIEQPPNCNERVAKIKKFTTFLAELVNDAHHQLFEYDLIINNLDINRGVPLNTANTNNIKLKKFIESKTMDGNLDDVVNIDGVVKIINKNPSMKDEIDIMIDSTKSTPQIDLIENIKTNLQDDKKLLDALILVQQSVIEGNLSKSIKRLKLIEISQQDSDSFRETSIHNLLIGGGNKP